VQGKKKRDAADAEAKLALKKAEEEASSNQAPDIQTNDAEASVDLLSSRDEDIIF